jgi:5'-deoxynucleotidase
MENGKKIESGYLALVLRQDLIKRWSLMYTARPENDLEHVGIVALLCYYVARIARNNGKDVSVIKLLNYGNFHDQNEVLSMDLISPIKNATPAMAKAYAEIEMIAEERLINSAPRQIQQELRAAYHPGGYEQKLGKACDSYHAYLKTKQECDVDLDNAHEFLDAYRKMIVVKDSLCAKYPEIKVLDEMFEQGLYKEFKSLLKPRNYSEKFTLTKSLNVMEHASMVCTLLFLINTSPVDTSGLDLECMMSFSLLDNDVGETSKFKPTLTNRELKLVRLCDDYVLYMTSCRDIPRLPRGIREAARFAIANYVNGILEQSSELTLIHDWFGSSFDKSFDALIRPFEIDAKLINAA